MRISLGLLPLLLTAACIDVADRDEEVGLLRLVPGDSAILHERDSAYLAEPIDMVVRSNGTMYVGDAFQRRVLEFDRSGVLQGVLGRAGRGPGEFRFVGPMAIAGDSLLLAADLVLNRISVFELDSRRFVNSVRYDGGLVHSMDVRNDTAWIGLMRAHPQDTTTERRTTVARWDLSDDSVHYLGEPPYPYDSEQVRWQYSFSVVSARSDTLLLGFVAHPDVFVADRSGRILDTLVLPEVRRRGVSRTLPEHIAPMRDPEEYTGALSVIKLLHPLSSGALAIVHVDLNMSMDGLVTGTGFVSLFDSSLTRACVDAESRFAQDARPLIAFHGDTLVALDLRVIRAESAVTVVRRFTLDTSGCSWLPTSSAKLDSREVAP